jgi:hypothetical protein
VIAREIEVLERVRVRENFARKGVEAGVSEGELFHRGGRGAMRGASLASFVNEGSSWSWSSSGTSAQVIDRNLLFEAPQSKRCFVLFSSL